MITKVSSNQVKSQHLLRWVTPSCPDLGHFVAYTDGHESRCERDTDTETRHDPEKKQNHRGGEKYLRSSIADARNTI